MQISKRVQSANKRSRRRDANQTTLNNATGSLFYHRSNAASQPEESSRKDNEGDEWATGVRQEENTFPRSHHKGLDESVLHLAQQVRHISEGICVAR